ncbi:Uncharacterized protein TCM_016316 [Theobroma cacao]|uniref:Uncharacterized protein n=1 Tax=Theobroma cacao TaxID=3641 RepID=A0A061G601_THECC|nr:Uncharacterized protein TCM_016316 [Theobroma cacao]
MHHFLNYLAIYVYIFIYFEPMITIDKGVNLCKSNRSFSHYVPSSFNLSANLVYIIFLLKVLQQEILCELCSSHCACAICHVGLNNLLILLFIKLFLFPPFCPIIVDKLLPKHCTTGESALIYKRDKFTIIHIYFYFDILNKITRRKIFIYKLKIYSLIKENK